MPGSEVHPHYYAVRLLNPYQGVAQIIEINGARAVSIDGVNWRLQLRSAIYKSPWSYLAVESDNGYFVYGVWSLQEGLTRIPIHPSLYHDHVETAAHILVDSISRSLNRLPFALQDTVELWLLDAETQQPVALLASKQPGESISPSHSLLWYPSHNTDVSFTSDVYSEVVKHDTMKCQPQELIVDIVRQRCSEPTNAMWIERDAEGNGNMLHDHKGKQSRQRKNISAHEFPLCLLVEEWESTQASQLINDYLNWQAPMLLMLPLPLPRRRELEHHAQQQPLSVYNFHRLYPEISDKEFLNKILVEAIMRRSSTEQ